jgi:hypothetical protein
MEESSDVGSFNQTLSPSGLVVPKAVHQMAKPQELPRLERRRLQIKRRNTFSVRRTTARFGCGIFTAGSVSVSSRGMLRKFRASRLLRWMSTRAFSAMGILQARMPGQPQIGVTLLEQTTRRGHLTTVRLSSTLSQGTGRQAQWSSTGLLGILTGQLCLRLTLDHDQSRSSSLRRWTTPLSSGTLRRLLVARHCLVS